MHYKSYHPYITHQESPFWLNVLFPNRPILILRAYVSLLRLDVYLTRRNFSALTKDSSLPDTHQKPEFLEWLNVFALRSIWLVSGTGKKRSVCSDPPPLLACSEIMEFPPRWSWPCPLPASLQGSRMGRGRRKSRQRQAVHAGHVCRTGSLLVEARDRIDAKGTKT